MRHYITRYRDDNKIALLEKLKAKLQKFRSLPLARKVYVIIDRIIQISSVAGTVILGKSLARHIQTLKICKDNLKDAKNELAKESLGKVSSEYKGKIVTDILGMAIHIANFVVAGLLRKFMYLENQSETRTRDSVMYLKRYNRRNDSIRLYRMIRRIDSLSERLSDAIYDYRMLRDAGVKGMKKGEHRMARDPEYVESLKGGGGGGHMSTGAKVATGLGAGALAAGALGAAFLGRRGMKGLAKAALRGAKSGLGSAKSGAKHALHSAKSGLSSAASKAKSGLSSVKSSLGTAEGRNNLKQRALIKGSHLKESLGNAYEGAKSTAKSTLNSLKTKEGREGLKQRARELKQRAQFAYGARAEKAFNKLENAAKKVPSAKQIRNKITSAASNVKSQAKNQAARLKNVAQQARTAEGRAELKNAFKKARQDAQIRASAAGRGMSYNNGKMRSQLFSNYR